MAKNELDDFLNGEPEGGPAPDAVEELLGVPSAPDKPAPEPKPQGDDPPEQDDDAPPATGTLAALQDERNKRRDWKEKAVRAETERDELRKQLDEAKRFAQQPPQQYQPPQPIDPSTHPEAFVERVQRVVLNERLNSSEMMLRREMGAEAVDAAIADFKQAAEQDPTLFPKLYQQPDPYGWMAKHVEVLRMRRDIGDDPAAYKARLRAEWEAERGATQEAPLPTPISPAARLAPSLANARSAAPRGAPAYTGPTDLDDILRR